MPEQRDPVSTRRRRRPVSNVIRINMAPVACREPYHDGLTGTGITSVISYWPVSQKSNWHDAKICLGENPAENFNRFDLCYSFNLLCDAEYGGRKGLHIATKNYMRNYSAIAGPYGNRRIPYERALRNLIVIMFSHSIDNFENTRSQEGHRTLVVHECLTVAHKLGKYHRWQRRVAPEDRHKEDWCAEVKPGQKDFRYKYSTALELLGSAQSPTYGHPRLLGRCYDNVYHQGQFIGKLTARGHPPTEENTKEVYNREYAEVVGRIQNSQDLDDLSAREFSVPYDPIPCSLKNPDIILHPEAFAERRNLPPPAPGRQKPARDYEMDGAVASVDVSWSQRIPDLEEDEIDRDPRYNQYPYQEGDELDEEEDMNTAESTVTHRPDAEYESGVSTLGDTPWSTHTDTDAATEFDTLRVGTPHPEHRHFAPPSAMLREPCGKSALTGPLAAFSESVGQAAAKLVTTQVFGQFHDPAAAGLPRPAAVSDEAERALRERFHQRRLAQAKTQRSQQAASTARSGSVFQRLGAPVQEESFQVRPEMTPRKVDRGRQQGRSSAAPDKPASRSQSGQKRRSGSRGREEVDPKKGKKDGGPVGATAGKDKRVGTGIDWQTAVIEKSSKKTSQHPSFKPDRGGTTKSPPEPKIKAAVVAKGTDKASESSARRNQTPSRSPQKKGKRQGPRGFKTKDRELTEKELVRDQAHHWVAQRADRLDPEGYREEANSLQYFGHNKVLYGLEMVAIIDWARKYLDLGMIHPLPILPPYLFSSFVASRQTANRPLVKDDSIYSATATSGNGSREDGSLRLRSYSFGLMNSQYWMGFSTVAGFVPLAPWRVM